MKFGSLMLTGVSLAAVAMPASAQVSAAAYDFDLPPQPLADALRTVAARAGLELYAPADAIIGLTSPRLDGRLTAADAIDRLLRGTTLRARFENGVVVIRSAAEGSTDATASNSAGPDIVVTGSRIAGAPPTAPVTTIGAAEIAASGYADLGEIARSLPQSFGGGQNPGIGSNQGVLNENANVNSASTFNLRGIGSNATLTLLNGNRLSYSGIAEALNLPLDVHSFDIDAIDIARPNLPHLPWPVASCFTQAIDAVHRQLDTRFGRFLRRPPVCTKGAIQRQLPCWSGRR